MLTDEQIESTLTLAGEAYTKNAGDITRYFARAIEAEVRKEIEASNGINAPK